MQQLKRTRVGPASGSVDAGCSKGLISVRCNLKLISAPAHPPQTSVTSTLHPKPRSRSRRFFRIYLFFTFSMEQSFCFVNGIHLDQTAKKRMRRHVMIGKNAGRTLHRRSKKELLRTETVVVRNAVSNVRQWNRRDGLECYEPLSIQNHVLTGFSFPVDLTLHHAETISNCKFEHKEYREKILKFCYSSCALRR